MQQTRQDESSAVGKQCCGLHYSDMTSNQQKSSLTCWSGIFYALKMTRRSHCLVFLSFYGDNVLICRWVYTTEALFVENEFMIEEHYTM
ncbi:hypothetical protein AVEN_72928-1 [Araneus ventricosus]|uniref:Uncharacterized protein n=1 Tax=Araneus ventricosus TaxID=182803 RepID=A0A4Y2GZR1_ARAVE|nr:hypothetical protein AVEN_72928-1 [Araneus ventricosus]